MNKHTKTTIRQLAIIAAISAPFAVYGSAFAASGDVGQSNDREMLNILILQIKAT